MLRMMFGFTVFMLLIGALFAYAKAIEFGLFERTKTEEIEVESEKEKRLEYIESINRQEEAYVEPHPIGEGGYTQRTFLSQPEQKFFQALRNCISPQAAILSKVRLADLIRAKDLSDFSKSQSLFNKISRKHIDFAICRASDLSILGLIEVDDFSHYRYDRKSRDEFVDKALAQAGIKIMHIKTQRQYASAELKMRLQAELGIAQEFLN